MNPAFPSLTRALVLAGVAATCGAATPPVLLSPVAVVGSDLETYSPAVSLENMINQSGVETPFVSGVTVFADYFRNPAQRFATSGDGGTNNWQSVVSFGTPVRGTVDFDLGARYRIDRVALWNRSLKDITFKVLEDLQGPEQVGGSFSLFDRQSFFFSYAADVLTLNTPLEGRYLRLVIDSVHPIQGVNFGYAVVGEVVVSATPLAVPPPSLRISRSATGDLRLEFTGILQSASSADGPFEDVPGTPQGLHEVPGGSLDGLRFYRAATR